MAYFGQGSLGEKIFRGAYGYSRNNNVYSEENFEVFRDKKEMTYTFVSEMMSRVATGELLTIKVYYKINKEFIPLEVDINRTLGNNSVRELYEYDQRKTRINYMFKNGDEETRIDFPTNPKFYITTSATCTSMLYLRSKKFDATGKNFYSLYTSKNLWDYKEEPSLRNIVVQRTSQTSENLKLDGSNLQAVQYKIQEHDLAVEAEENKPPPKGGIKTPTPIQEEIKIWTSQHMTIPYLVKANDGTKIQVKFLNNLIQD